jgi:hypothetical protein
MRRTEEDTRHPTPPRDNPAGPVVLDAVLALRAVVRERGVPPFGFAGLRVMDALDDLGASLDRCLETRGSGGWPVSAR